MAEGRPLRATEVAELLGISGVRARQVLQALEAEGLVVRGLMEMPRTRQPAATWTFHEVQAAS
ncbi:helix-turn-helix domain-containing protein [Amycolatopsis sp. VC5-11]|uniref:helix-turn-helix domain-containing protein n=1 Tax=Amycolatopsis sp. VC5-11 TaxID=3120156 RepID=UPI00300A03F7